MRHLQPGAVASWWQPGHPGWAIYPVDSEQFMSTGALESVSVPNEQIVAPQPQMGGTCPAHPVLHLCQWASPSFCRFQAVLERRHQVGSDLLCCGCSARSAGWSPVPAAAAAWLRAVCTGQPQHGLHGAATDVRGARLRHALLSRAGRIRCCAAALQLPLPHAHCSQDLRCRTHGPRRSSPTLLFKLRCFLFFFLSC